MKIGLFGYPGNPLREAAERGLRRLGHHIVGQVPGAWSPGTAFRDLAAVVVCGLRGPCGEAARYYRSLDVPVVLIDYPHLARGEGWWRVSPPDLAHLPEFKGKAPRDRLDAIGVEPETRKRVKGQHVLVLGQRGGDPTHGMSRGEMQAWAEATVETLRSLTDSKIVWRPHPTEVYEIAGADGFSDPREESIHRAFDGAWLVVTDSSTGGLEALIAGLPVIATGNPPYKGLAYGLGDFKNVSAPNPKDLEELLARVAYTQWTEEEIATGEPFAALLPDPDAAPRTEEESAEIAALAKIPEVDASAAEAIFAAGITSRRVWDQHVTLDQIEKLGLAPDADAALRKAAGLTTPEAPEPEPENPPEPEGEAGNEPDEEIDAEAEVALIAGAIPRVGEKTAESLVEAGQTLETLRDLPEDQIEKLGLAPSQAAALRKWQQTLTEKE